MFESAIKHQFKFRNFDIFLFNASKNFRVLSLIAFSRLILVPIKNKFSERVCIISVGIFIGFFI